MPVTVLCGANDLSLEFDDRPYRVEEVVKIARDAYPLLGEPMWRKLNEDCSIIYFRGDIKNEEIRTYYYPIDGIVFVRWLKER
jgi:hypothetical protein